MSNRMTTRKAVSSITNAAIARSGCERRRQSAAPASEQRVAQRRLDQHRCRNPTSGSRASRAPSARQIRARPWPDFERSCCPNRPRSDPASTSPDGHARSLRQRRLRASDDRSRYQAFQGGRVAHSANPEDQARGAPSATAALGRCSSCGRGPSRGFVLRGNRCQARREAPGRLGSNVLTCLLARLFHIVLACDLG